MAIENTTTVKAVTSGTQLSSVGIVKTVVGLVKAVDANGAERVLQAGDKVYANETIVTSADGGVIIEFPNGSHLDLPRSAHIMLDPEIYSASASKSIEQEASDEAARIAKAIAEGRDPNAVANPAAAGGEAGDEGTTTPLVVDFDNTQGNVNSGYPTGPISLTFPPMHEELPPVPETAAAIIQTPPTVDVTPPVYTPPEQTPPPHTALDGIVSPGQVFEEGLDQAGTDKDGTSKDTDAEIALGGTIVIADAEGLADIASVTIGGVQFTIGAGGLAALVGEEIPGNYGFLKITAYDGNGTFTYSYTLTSNTTDNAGDETDSFAVVVTDTAGLNAGATIVITIIDDVPLLNVTAAPTLGPLSVVEASGAGEGKEVTTTITAPEFTYLAGADGLQSLTTTYALTLAGGTATGLVTTDGGYPITLSVSGDGQTITGLYNGSNVAFTISLSGTTVTLVSNVALEHDNNQGPVPAEDNTLDISSLIKVTATITVTDNDGDVVSTNVSTTNPLSIEFVDTSPVSLTPTAIHMIDLATAPAITENLHFVSGADGVQTVKFTIIDGVAAIDESTGNQLAYNGQKLYLHYGQTDGVIDYTIIVATTSSAPAPNGVLTTDTNVAYWIDINPDPLSGVGGSYTMHSNGVISNGTETTATNLSSVGGGNVVLKAISNIGGTTEDVVLTTKSGLTVNTNANVIGIGSGQSFSSTDGIRFDFTNGDVSGNGGNAVYTADGTHNLTTSFKQEISLTAGASHADITIKAILADSDNVYYGDPSGESSVSITGVRVYSGTLAQVQAGTATEILDGQSVNGITLDYTINGDGTINIVGLQSGWVFVVETTDSFSALQIDSLNTTGNYKLGLFAYGESSAGDPVDLSYNIVGVDGDGDTVSGSLEATLYPASATQSGIDDGTPNDTLTGTINTDYLLGNLGDDVLSGLGGNDVLVGGAGTDTLTGGSGVDRFVMTNGDGPDIITDFTLGNLNPVNGAVSANADILDISDVLAGAEITAAEFASSPGSFITFVQSGSDTNVVLDLDGVAGGTTHVVATLQNTTATNFDINTLIGNGQIDYTS